jgi:hypothetical protein
MVNIRRRLFHRLGGCLLFGGGLRDKISAGRCPDQAEKQILY